MLGLSGSAIGNLTISRMADTAIRAELSVSGAPLILDLEKHSVRADTFEVRAQRADGSWDTLPAEPVRTYRGTVVGEMGSQVAASMLDDGLHARVRRADGEEYWLEPLAPRVHEASAGQHVIYRTVDVIDEGNTCDADLFAPVVAPGDLSNGTGYQYGGGSVSAEIACDADFEFFSNHGSGTQARIESIINSINLQYSSDVGISHSITTILIRSSSNDPYSRKGASQLLNQLRNEWNNNQSSVQRDVVHLFTGRNLSGNTIGIAYVGTVCNLSVAYGLVESDFNSNFACSTDLSAHELGHNWGASHCSCSGYTMNASITCANDFNPTGTIPTIVNYRNSQSCFGAPPTTGSVDGLITDSTDGSPIAGATVQTDSGQSDVTAGDGTYSMSGVPTGSRTITASASGFTADSAGTNVSQNQTSTVNIALDPAPVGSQAIVDCITYRSSGGQNQDRNLFIDITIVDDGGAPVAGASVSVSVDLNGGAFGTATATTDSSGEVTLQAKNSPNGCFETDVTGVSAAGLSFDGTEPANGFAKGSDSSPDADCRSGSDGCGAG